VAVSLNMILGLLKKLGVKTKKGIKLAAAEKKLRKALEDPTFKTPPTKTEIKGLTSMGYDVSEDDDEDESDEDSDDDEDEDEEDSDDDESSDDESDDDEDSDEDSSDDEDEKPKDKKKDKKKKADAKKGKGKAKKKGKKDAGNRNKRGSCKEWLITFFKKNAKAPKKEIIAAYIKDMGEKSRWTCENYLAQAKRDEALLGHFLYEAKIDGVRTYSKKQFSKTVLAAQEKATKDAAKKKAEAAKKKAAAKKKPAKKEKAKKGKKDAKAKKGKKKKAG